MMDGLSFWPAIITTAIATLLSGALLGRWWSYRLGNRKLDGEREDKEAERRKVDREEARKDFALLLQVVTGQRDDALLHNSQQEGKIGHLELEIQGLRLSREIDPFPNWIVTLEGLYIYVNAEFEAVFLLPIGLTYKDMIGKKHEKIFPPDFAHKLHHLDEVAKSTADKRARATLMIRSRQVTVHKFPICIRGVPVAFAGYITEIDELPKPREG